MRPLRAVGMALTVGGLAMTLVGLVGLLATGGGDEGAPAGVASAQPDGGGPTPSAEPADDSESPAPEASDAAEPSSAEPSEPSEMEPPPAQETADPGLDPDADVPVLLDALEAAVVATDVDTLMDLLHPAVLETFGDAECRERLAALDDDTFALDLREVGEAESWEWDSGQGVVTVPSAIPVEVSRVRQGETVIQEIHLAYADGALRWFTLCAPASDA